MEISKNPHCPIWVIDEIQDKYSQLKGTPFSGYPGSYIKKWGDIAGIQEIFCHYLSENILKGLSAYKPRVIIALGTRTMLVFTNNEWKHLMKYRGSPFLIPRDQDSYTAVIPTISPRNIKSSNYTITYENEEDEEKYKISIEKRVIEDFKKANRILSFGEKNKPYLDYAVLGRKDEIITTDDIAEIEKWAQEAQQNKARIVVDIETNPKEKEILCVGFGYSSYQKESSLVIPWKSNLIGYIDAICALPNEKITQNGHYDFYWLAMKAQIEPKSWKWDTMQMHHILDPLEEHNLQFLSSVYTYRQYWKDEGKFNQKVTEKPTRSFQELMNYCAKDCIGEALVQKELESQLQKANLLDIYIQTKQNLLYPTLDLMLTGIRTDRVYLRNFNSEFTEKAAELRDEIAKIYNNSNPLFTFKTKREYLVWELWKTAESYGSDWSLFIDTIQHMHIPKTENSYYKPEDLLRSANNIRNATVSSQKFKELLYGKLKVPKVMKKRKDSGESTPTTDETTLKKIQTGIGRKRPEVFSLCDKYLKHQRFVTLRGFCKEEKLDPDSRMRSSYRSNTETSRFRSSSNPMYSGNNAQQNDREIRPMYIPKDGYLFGAVDIGQAEFRVVAAYSLDNQLIEMALTHHSEFDIMTYVTHLVCDIPIEEVKKDVRDIHKRILYATKYGMGPYLLSDLLLKDLGLEQSVEWCNEKIEYIMHKLPGIPMYQQMTRDEMLTKKHLYNAWGQKWDVSFEEWKSQKDIARMFRRGFAWRPQSDIGNFTNIRGLNTLYKLKKSGVPLEINANVHDEVIFSAPVSEIHNIFTVLNKSISCTPFTVAGTNLYLPCGFKLMPRWGGENVYEWKKLPTKEEIKEASNNIKRKKAPNK